MQRMALCLTSSRTQSVASRPRCHSRCRHAARPWVAQQTASALASTRGRGGAPASGCSGGVRIASSACEAHHDGRTYGVGIGSTLREAPTGEAPARQAVLGWNRGQRHTLREEEHAT
jgi:hypothetical protein